MPSDPKVKRPSVLNGGVPVWNCGYVTVAFPVEDGMEISSWTGR